MKRVSGEFLKLLAKAVRSPLFQAFSWATRTLMMLSSWRLAVWSGFGSCAGRRAGARRVKMTAARRNEERSVIWDLEGGVGLYGVTVDDCFIGRALGTIGLIVDDWRAGGKRFWRVIECSHEREAKSTGDNSSGTNALDAVVRRMLFPGFDASGWGDPDDGHKGDEAKRHARVLEG